MGQIQQRLILDYLSSSRYVLYWFVRGGNHPSVFETSALVETGCNTSLKWEFGWKGR
jgi:hypothetical protein